MSAFICKKVPLLKAIVWELCWRFFSSVCGFCKTKGSYYWKHNFCRLCVHNPASRLLQIGQKSEKWQWCHTFDAVLFLLSSLVTGPRFMSILSLVLELWQFPFIKDWPEILKSEIPTSEIFPISGEWGELWIANLARMSLIPRGNKFSRVQIFAEQIFAVGWVRMGKFRGTYFRGRRIFTKFAELTFHVLNNFFWGGGIKRKKN